MPNQALSHAGIGGQDVTLRTRSVIHNTIFHHPAENDLCADNVCEIRVFGSHRADGLTFAMMYVLAFPPSESCTPRRNVVMLAS